MNWKAYGKWKHPKMIGQIRLESYLKTFYPSTIKLNPKFIKARDELIVFKMEKHIDEVYLSILALECKLKELEILEKYEECQIVFDLLDLLD